MTLGFSTKWPDRMGELAGQPNYFIDSIWNSIHSTSPNNGVSYVEEIEYEEKHCDLFGGKWHSSIKSFPKYHTIREDPHHRWKAGNDIHFVINNRTKNRFQFAPVVKCVSVQEIEIIDAMHLGKNDPNVSFYDTVEILGIHWHYALTVKVDGKILRKNAVHVLAINDGFESVWDFFQYFNEDFKGKIIHWTRLSY